MASVWTRIRNRLGPAREPAPPAAFEQAAPDLGMEVCLRGLAARGYAPSSVLDVGAAVGGWTVLALQFWPQASYFLVEPLEERQASLEALKSAHPNVDYIVAGAADRDGRLSLGVAPGLFASSFAYPGPVNRTVPVVRLDGLFEQRRFPQPQLLKLDVQGYERRVLAGAEQVLAGCELVLMEVQFIRFCPEMWLVHEAVAWMAGRGFLPYEFVDVLRRPLDGAMGQCDILFARSDHWLRADSRWG